MVSMQFATYRATAEFVCESEGNLVRTRLTVRLNEQDTMPYTVKHLTALPSIRLKTRALAITLVSLFQNAF